MGRNDDEPESTAPESSQSFAAKRYEAAFAGKGTNLPVRIEALREAALAELDEDTAAFLAGGAGGDRTLDHNRRGFERWRIVPRPLRDVEERDHEVNVLGTTLPAPIALAPVGIQARYAEDGELATARAAASHGVPLVASAVSSRTLEAIADETGDAPAWFQLYASTDDAVVGSFVDRAEAAGYDALVVTVDAPLMGWRERTIDRESLPFFNGQGIANYLADPAFRDRLDDPPELNEAGDVETAVGEAAIREFAAQFGRPSLDWNDLERIAERTDLPVVIKGLLHPDDAAEAVERGFDGVVVSNHGGRQVDNAVASIDALPRVVDAVDDRIPVLFDSGVRRGADAFVALALGADAVLLGRPYLYGLAIDGEAGVRAVLANFLGDLDATLALAGYDSWRRVDETALQPTSPSDRRR